MYSGNHAVGHFDWSVITKIWILRGLELISIGILEVSYYHKIFGMYKTFHGNSDARGVGLFITKNQIEAMNGSIDIESIVGQGTEFKVVLGE